MSELLVGLAGIIEEQLDSEFPFADGEVEDRPLGLSSTLKRENSLISLQ